MKIKNIHCPICHRRTYFTGKIVYESGRTKVVEWKCTDCGVIIKSRHDKLGEEYDRRKKRGVRLSAKKVNRLNVARSLLRFREGHEKRSVTRKTGMK
jgi:transposase-like protein